METKKLYYEPIEDLDAEYQSISKYAELLNKPQWQKRRNEVLEKDGRKCTKCRSISTIKLWGQPVRGAQILGRTENNSFVIEPIFSKKHISLHVHHILYVIERNPWDYNNDELITLCFDCHMKEHEEVIIPVYLREVDLHIAASPNIISCPKCGGEGYLPEYHYFKAGVCFGCQGKCFVKIKLLPASSR